VWLLWDQEEKEVSTGANGRRAVVTAVGWNDYQPEKKPKKRYRSYKRGFGRSRYAKGKPAKN
jgi:hypothetical protein